MLYFGFVSVVVLGYTDTSVDVHQDAVKKVFQRALQYCDHKKLHLALLALYERTEQYQLADELLDRMTKRFKTSCKVSLSVSFFFLSGRGSELYPICIWSIIMTLYNVTADMVVPYSVFPQTRQGC